jgi:hypothetical protein
VGRRQVYGGFSCAGEGDSEAAPRDGVVKSPLCDKRPTGTGPHLGRHQSIFTPHPTLARGRGNYNFCSETIAPRPTKLSAPERIINLEIYIFSREDRVFMRRTFFPVL